MALEPTTPTTPQQWGGDSWVAASGGEATWWSHWLVELFRHSQFSSSQKLRSLKYLIQTLAGLFPSFPSKSTADLSQQYTVLIYNCPRSDWLSLPAFLYPPCLMQSYRPLWMTRSGQLEEQPMFSCYLLRDTILSPGAGRDRPNKNITRRKWIQSLVFPCYTIFRRKLSLFPSQLACLSIVPGKIVVIDNLNNLPAIFLLNSHYLPLQKKSCIKFPAFCKPQGRILILWANEWKDTRN